MTSNCWKSLYGRMLYSSMKMKFHLIGFCMYHLQCLGTGCETKCDNCRNQSPDHHHLPRGDSCRMGNPVRDLSRHLKIQSESIVKGTIVTP